MEKVCFFKKVLVLNPYPQTPFSRKGAILLGLPPQTKQGGLQSAAQSHCTMRWHKWLTTCTGATPLRPLFYQRYRFIDSLKPPRLKGGFPFIRFSSQALYTSSISCSRDRSKISCPAFCQARSPTFHSQSPS